MSPRARDLGIVIGELRPGPLDAITDVRGVRVGHSTIIRGDGPLVVGQGPVRTGVTIVMPHGGDPFREAVYGGSHRLNGNGEMTGLLWLRESGLLASPIALTNTHSVGVVRDALVTAEVRSEHRHRSDWLLPIVAETWDSQLNDCDGQHVTAAHVDEALANASDGPVPEGNVGGGTGMVCHEFKGGIGTASRVLGAEAGGWTVGVLVQSNYGWRSRLRVDGVPVGRQITTDEVPSPYDEGKSSVADAASAGSIIVIVATDAPLLPGQCERLAQRAGLGLARVGGAGENGSGDLFLAFSTGNGPIPVHEDADERELRTVRSLPDAAMTPLFWAVIDATEEAILDSMLMAETMTGRDGITAHALPVDRLLGIMARHRPD